MELELVYLYPVTLVPAVVGRFSILASPLLKEFEEHNLQFTSIIPLFFFYSYISKFLSDLQGQPLPLVKLYARALHRFTSCSSSKSRASLRIYMDTAVVVVLSYLSLLKINLSYIWLAVFPTLTLAFIAALFNEELRGDRRAAVAEEDDAGGGKITRSSSRRCFAVSQFLLFLGSTLGALALMAARLSQLAGAAPGLAPASELLRRATLVVMLVTAHAAAAELLGEATIALLCLPELAPALFWFTLHLDGESSPAATIDGIKSHRNVLSVLAAAAVASVAYLAAAMGERGLSVSTITMVSCGVSGLLPIVRSPLQYRDTNGLVFGNHQAA
ncbi:hypothetical protein OsJ_01663 [Oryza sativa Japonica Group]|uniref:Uncharacterized protein n=1 Tax=Oryza sativa subsp. japonica TaxID=39947 RepID=B9EWB4_ORYSJ|nr:hypothetical protein OsJ_01663 [Oryza sativa Japonica Group]